MLGKYTLDLDPVDKGRSTVGGFGSGGITFDTVSCFAVGLLSSRFSDSVQLCPLSLLWYMNDFESSSITRAQMCLDLLKLSGCARTLQKGRILIPPCREARRYLTLPQLT
ncbi:hypothetical protein M9H77_17391 [Catharanthus roseus]|uniref:Uncharacterized protein n=1 Tax=Catharanthus roseus TaxID=4058 RepID=A0ACC0B4T9_CATRO|nr:hypothetical protein M9H77_17391 [Catharanthus roseus]